MHTNPHTTLITPDAKLAANTHGGRAKCLQRLVRLEMPVPRTVALSFQTVHRIAGDDLPDIAAILDQFAPGALLCVRPSSEDPDWGGPGAVLNIGMNDARFGELRARLGEEVAARIYQRFVQSYAVHVARLDPDVFDDLPEEGLRGLDATLRAYEDETDEPFPQDPGRQLAEVLRSMARAWEGTSARLLRQAKGAPADAGLGLVVQEMIPGFGREECGSGVLQLVDTVTGQPQVTGRYLSQSQGRDALGAGTGALYLAKDPRGPSLEDVAPEAFAALKAHAALMREHLREEMQVEFVIENGHVHILDGVRVPRGSRAAVRIAVRLAEDGIITPQEAVMRVEPHSLNELLHRQVAPRAKRDVLATGIGASPGAATGRIVFNSADAQASAARREPCVLVRRETSPEDIRGMHASVAVLTERGGMTSHAAVLGRGLGLPCIVDARTARNFDAQGIGLCRTEHMFFEPGRLTVMREMIFAETSSGRAAVLERLLPMQREDFIQLFRIMQGQPVCIRLFDPPLHEFLPATRSGQRELAEALDIPVSDVTRRVEAMGEYNPMLGLRGVRLGVTVPEIYDMQARAIFEATLEASRDGDAVVPEIMIPLVSARREVELVQSRIDAVAAAVRTERGRDFDYRLGVMVETPRAALRAAEFAPLVSFLSFGTNDLTQMTYGLSRDDAGRFMSTYVKQGVFPEDPFHVLDTDGVGELLKLGVERGRAANPNLTMSICGEHGGNPESIAFCRAAGFDYVSCSPFRVPVARLAAAQLAIKHKIGTGAAR